MPDTSAFAAPEPRGSLNHPLAAAAGLLAGCRDRLAHGLATAFAQHMGKATEDLLGMADRATSLEQQRLFVSAMDFLGQRGQELLQQFRTAYVERFETGVAALRSEPAMPEPDELRLVDTADFERDLAIGKVSARAAANCSQQLTALDRRLAAILRRPRVSQDDNPLYPRTLFAAMLQALSELEAQEQLALILLHAFERHTSVELPGIYADLNRFLVQAGVLPTIPLAGPLSTPRGQRRVRVEGGVTPDSEWAGLESPAAQDSARGEDGTQTDRPAPAGGHAVSGRTSTQPGDDVFGQLARAIQAAGSQRAPRAMAGGASSGGAAPALGLSQLIQTLNGLQHGFADPREFPGLGQIQIDPRRPDVLQQIRATPVMTWSRPLDAVTIDIVAMLFDAIFNDTELSATVRAEIAKLQIPVLKVALIDKSFFSDRRHPARRLLDAIANSGIGRNDMDEPRLVDKVREIVDAVVDGFDSDVDVFSAQLRKLGEFLREEEEHARDNSLRVFDQLEQRDRQEIAATRISKELDARISGVNMPSLVAGFLDRHWRPVLTDVFVHSGDAGADWGEAVATMDDLIWSVQPKDTLADRNRLLAALPELLKRLRRGLEAVHQEDAWDPFFDRLIRLHMAALHKELPYEPPAEVGVSASPTGPAGTSGEAWANDASGIRYRRPQTDEDGPPDPCVTLARSLNVGAWVEFQNFRGTRKTLRLGWVSKYRGVYLFTNRQGDNALTLATTSLAAHLRKGTARVLSQDPLTDRAVAQILAQGMPEQRSGSI
ncbi:MAG: DUF1631 domain-containing protein [Thiocapsa sp.]|nr:DUF1631 domain-containing protein [Thiocapsa sp.]MCG6897928.1 DUF1631 domain-containing protein [Thiocapsa sp.]